MGKNVWALVLTHLGGILVLATVLAGILPFFYNRGIVYYGFGGIKIGLVIAGLVMAGFGLFNLCKKPVVK